jgi:TRAP-type transport system small permease protein
MIEAHQGLGIIETVRVIIAKIIGLFIGLLLAGMVILVFGNVVARYFLNASIGWSEEVSRFMLIWLAFLGAVAAYIKNEHLGLDILVKYLPENASKVIVIAADIFVLIALVYITNGGIDMTKDSLASGWVSSAVPIPYGFVYMIAPISSFLMLIECLFKTGSDISKLRHTAEGGR